ncbi:MAG: transcriptional repressor LexA [Oculatellaceae cyanobacterium bins.114]|nr:transcriptional repressor LexA [Oculatellaceae cyanobacterium bins.114]
MLHLSHWNLLVYLEDYIDLRGYPPSMDEMMAAMKKSRGAIQNSLNHLELEGYIERECGKPRTIKILKSSRDSIPINQGGNPVSQNGIPIWGTIAAGYLTESFTDNYAKLPIFSPMLKPGDFALRVAGDSMIGDHITDDSFVIMRPVDDPDLLKDGEIVAAWVEGRGTTLKHFYRNGDYVSLVASNPKYPQIVINTEECQVVIQGILVFKWQGYP